jgi:hypothetical protein
MLLMGFGIGMTNQVASAFNTKPNSGRTSLIDCLCSGPYLTNMVTGMASSYGRQA